MANLVVVGIKRIQTKKGTIATTVYCTKPFSQYDTEHSESLVGLGIAQEYVSADLKAVHVGDEVKFEYEKGYEDKAFCVGVTVLKAAR